jgi:hypothetical protein
VKDDNVEVWGLAMRAFISILVATLCAALAGVAAASPTATAETLGKCRVPYLFGMSPQYATKRLRAAGCKGSVTVTKAKRCIRPGGHSPQLGRVIQQRPGSNVTVGSNTPITLWVLSRCGAGTPTPTPPPAPAPAPANFGGAWQGTFTATLSANACGTTASGSLSINLTQQGTTVNGTVAYSVTGGTLKPSPDPACEDLALQGSISLNGAVANNTLTGSGFTITLASDGSLSGHYSGVVQGIGVEADLTARRG